jgi:hypothetical protein
MDEKSIARSAFNLTPTLVGIDYGYNERKLTYQEIVKRCRYYYENDPIAGAVLSRMADMAVTQVKNRKIKNKKVNAFYDAVAEMITPTLKAAALEFLLHGMVVFDHVLAQAKGSDLSQNLGSIIYTYPKTTWIRDVMTIELKKLPIGLDRAIYYKVSPEEVYFFTHNGEYTDGTKDPALYQEYVRDHPEYVAAIKAGETKFKLPQAIGIFRKLNAYDVYPRPYLRNALRALEHKEHIKRMDRALASRAIEAMRHVQVGSDAITATDEDITAQKNALETASAHGDGVFNFVTSHLVNIKWVLPPLEVILSEEKYVEPNADIFMALGFPRVLTVGETQRSNSSNSSVALLGPVSTLNDIRDYLLFWVKKLYAILADANGFTLYPDPYWTSIPLQDITALTQFALTALEGGAISKDTVAQLYGTSYEEEYEKIRVEQELDKELPDRIDPPMIPNGNNQETPTQPTVSDR